MTAEWISILISLLPFLKRFRSKRHREIESILLGILGDYAADRVIYFNDKWNKVCEVNGKYILCQKEQLYSVYFYEEIKGHVIIQWGRQRLLDSSHIAEIRDKVQKIGRYL